MKALLLLSLIALTAAAAVQPVQDAAEAVLELHEESQLVEDVLPVPEEEEAAAEQMDAPAQGRFFFCPSGWERFKNNCYLYVRSSQSWSNAESHCARLGASLASAHDVFDYSFLQGLTQKAGYITAWIGGFYFQSWRWVDQSRYSYSNWSSMNSVSSYPCIYLRSNAGWSNSGCSTSRSAICMRRTDTC